MTPSQFHDSARRLALSRGITIEAARSELGRRGAVARKRKNYGRTVVTEKTQAEALKACGRYWWMDRD